MRCIQNQICHAVFSFTSQVARNSLSFMSSLITFAAAHGKFYVTLKILIQRTYMETYMFTGSCTAD